MTDIDSILRISEIKWKKKLQNQVPSRSKVSKMVTNSTIMWNCYLESSYTNVWFCKGDLLGSQLYKQHFSLSIKLYRITILESTCQHSYLISLKLQQFEKINVNTQSVPPFFGSNYHPDWNANSRKVAMYRIFLSA